MTNKNRMTDREKIIKTIEKEKVLIWLEICGKNRDCSGCCPYGDETGEDNMSRCREDLMAAALALLKEQEAIVRCKDCKHWDVDDHECNIKMGWFACDADWFCADGERK